MNRFRKRKLYTVYIIMKQYPDIIRVAFVRETQIPELDDIHQIDTFF